MSASRLLKTATKKPEVERRSVEVFTAILQKP